MFEVEVVRIGDALAGVVAAPDPDRLEGVIATDLFAGLDRIERLAWAGKTLLARSSGTGTGAGP